tara:strand:- start:1630 stop:2457 length:828 start_codon:yes stop_codon:yes gene_type:complete
MKFKRIIPRKRFGQHWLVDQVILDKIVEAADISSNDRILEIGPGKGSLTTQLISSRACVVHAIEVDRDLTRILKQKFSHEKKFSLSNEDVLNSDLIFPDGYYANKVVANIPYNITSPILNKLIGRLSKYNNITYKTLILLLQKEVAERITAKPGASNYSAISVRMQLMANSISICDVPPKAFYPEPKVYSKVLAINPKLNSDRIDIQVGHKVEVLLNKTFGSRRKMLRNTLKGLSFEDDLSEIFKYLNLSPDQRPQEISPENWVLIADKLTQNIF